MRISVSFSVAICTIVRFLFVMYGVQGTEPGGTGVLCTSVHTEKKKYGVWSMERAARN